MLTEEIYFELSDNENFVRMEHFELPYIDSDSDWDKNCIRTKITVKSDVFTGSFTGDFTTLDFEKFKQELAKLYDNLIGGAQFYGHENYLDLRIKGDGFGHFDVNVSACANPGYGGTLDFEISFDQTQINDLVSQLDKITDIFPISGDIKSPK